MRRTVLTFFQRAAVILAKAPGRLSHPAVFFFCGLWMMALLAAGTISQKYIGLYPARQKYFSAFFF